MDFMVQPALIERTVFEAARNDGLLRPHYERQFADCYDHPADDVRDRAFAALHERWFDELGLRERIASMAAEFPYVRSRVTRLRVAQAPGPKGHGVELFGAAGGGFTVVMAVQPALLLDAAAFQYWARHELMHVDDMLNPAFGFDGDQRPAGTTPAARNLIQDRYAALWATSVDLRLAGQELTPPHIKRRRRAELIRAFNLPDCEDSHAAIDALLRDPRWLAPTHAGLLEWAHTGLPDLPASIATERGRSESQPGSECPLCRFPTFDWFEDPDDLARLEQVIRADFPSRDAGRPICRRCAEIYRASLPATERADWVAHTASA